MRAPLVCSTLPFIRKERRCQVPFLKSLVWRDMGLNPGLPDHWQTLYPLGQWNFKVHCPLFFSYPAPYKSSLRGHAFQTQTCNRSRCRVLSTGLSCNEKKKIKIQKASIYKKGKENISVHFWKMVLSLQEKKKKKKSIVINALFVCFLFFFFVFYHLSFFLTSLISTPNSFVIKSFRVHPPQRYPGIFIIHINFGCFYCNSFGRSFYYDELLLLILISTDQKLYIYIYIYIYIHTHTYTAIYC